MHPQLQLQVSNGVEQLLPKATSAILVFWPLPAEASLTDLLLTATHDAVPPPPLSPDPGVLDVGAGAAKVMWVSLLLVLFCDIALAIKFRATSVYTTPINWQ